uniref:Uncharacterized protein n=1 Tax=Timema poppense TaxID=170557 RepID=A0A7R9GWU4_TIMPO|nr:unnamed protein product [Timema poppensis]
MSGMPGLHRGSDSTLNSTFISQSPYHYTLALVSTTAILFNDSEEQRYVDRIRANAYREAMEADVAMINRKWIATKLHRRERWNLSAVKVVVVVLLGAILIPAWADEEPKPSKQNLDAASKPISSKSATQQHSFGVTAFLGAGGPAVGSGAYYPGYGTGIGSGFGGYPGYNRGYYPSAVGAYPAIGGYQNIGGYPGIGGYQNIGGYPGLGGYSGLSNGGYYPGLGGGMGLPFNFYSSGKKGAEAKKPVEEIQKA